VQCTGNWAGAQGGNRNPDGGIETKSYDSARALIRGLEAATRAAGRLPDRAEVVNSIRTIAASIWRTRTLEYVVVQPPKPMLRTSH